MDLEVWIRSIVSGFILDSPENTLGNQENNKAWEEPLVGFSNGNDALYTFYKKDIGEFYLTPLEIFTRTFTDIDVDAARLTVISWILPHNERTKSDNRRRRVYPSERWARARIFGEQVNDKLRGHVVDSLQNRGFRAVAPMLSPIWKVYDNSRYGRASNWSERHAAYASGLGTFGLCDGLITEKGKAMRCGSVVTDMKLQPTERPYDTHHAYCLFFSRHTCGRCIPRCPADAINKSGHDKTKCRNHLRETSVFVKQNYGFEGYGCGMCQTGVPCESKIPTQEDL
ncbi:MAG: epoxyqueuosine reductase [Candidatus Bathyarchaeota archaeon]|nr:MAG: epoxyqueuosine reductase [Candidatus Bathyarchaeota archaeon]